MWGKFFQSYKGGRDEDIIAVYTNYESDQTGVYDFYIGTAQTSTRQPTQNTPQQSTQNTSQQSTQNPPQNQTIQLPTGKYLVAEINVENPESLQSAVANVWQNVWCNTDLKRTFVADYELYTSPTSVAICIGVEG